MKKIFILLALLSMVGCASAPPKIGVVVLNDDDIRITDKSSEALKVLNSYGAKGVRDLTALEFKKTKKDIELFEKEVAYTESFNRAIYEAGGVGLGLAAGLSASSVLGYGALTTIFADNRPDNYDFAWDFEGKVKVYSDDGVVDFDEISSAYVAAHNSSIKLLAEYLGKGSEVLDVKIAQDGFEKELGAFNLRRVYNNKRKAVRVEIDTVYLKTFYSADNQKGFGGRSYCGGGVNGCEITTDFFGFSNMHAMTTPIFRLIAIELGEKYTLYMPPNKSIYRVPLIIRGGTGEIEYLVEK